MKAVLQLIQLNYLSLKTEPMNEVRRLCVISRRETQTMTIDTEKLKKWKSNELKKTKQVSQQTVDTSKFCCRFIAF